MQENMETQSILYVIFRLNSLIWVKFSSQSVKNKHMKRKT